jgi:hypothetical protein
MKFLLFFALFSGGILAGFCQSRYTVSGYVREAGSRELLIGVNVYLPGATTGTTTNTYGFYSLTLPAADSVTVVFSYVGYATASRTVPLRKNVELNVDLAAGQVLQEVVVESTREKVSETPQMSTLDIPIKQIKIIPALLGEKDVLKVLQLMPGVQKGSEGSSGLYVRGGGPDQNLIILDDATVYNAYHLFGFFSLFNGDALKSVELTKGGFPARYGGRLSSVLEMNMKEGSKEELHGEGGIGIISSRLTLESPIQKGKSSFILSGRRTYIDALVRPFIPEGDAGYYFYDLTAKVNHDFGRKDKLYLSGYFGQDRFFVQDKFDGGRSKVGFNWGNATGTLRWNHLFNDKLFANTSLIFSNYQFRIYQDEESSNGDEFALDYRSGIRDVGIKQDWDFFPSPRHSVKFGLSSTYHRFTPSAIVVKDSQINEFTREVQAIDVAESGLYAEDTWRPLDRLRLNAGFRLSHYATEGRQYLRPEPRLAVSYTLMEDLSAKASYAQMNQYVHLLSNTGIGLPTDLWVPTTARVAPQQSRQVAAGLAKDFTERGLQLTLEGYYKKMDNIIGYREGASFLLIEDGPESAGQVNWEDNVTAGQGWSYGAELLLQKKAGRFSGWVGYTLSWTQLQFDELNFGRKYYARYDRRHDLSLVGIYEISPRITLSGTWVYGTGNAITMPLSQYQAPEHEPGPGGRYWSSVNDYGPKNSFRMAAYHRLDFGIQFHKKMKRHERTWEFSLYNAYSRQNPFFYYIDSQYNDTTNENKAILKQISLFPIIPSFSYNFKF